MLLTVDIGNTSITLGIFEGERFVEEFRLASDKDLALEEYEVLLKSLLKSYEIDGCIISSVVEELTNRLKSACDNVLSVDSIILSSKINTGVKICIDNPEEAGADRIANAYGAYVLYGRQRTAKQLGVLEDRKVGCSEDKLVNNNSLSEIIPAQTFDNNLPSYPPTLQPSNNDNLSEISQSSPSAIIVVDFGTATTFDIVNSKGEFIGGIISLGIMSQLKALNKFTSKLPKEDVSLSPKAIGHNTHDAILSGVIRGTASMIDGMIEQCEKELGEKAIIVATGGYSGLIANYLKRTFDYINPILTLEGLRYLYNINYSSSSLRKSSTVTCKTGEFSSFLKTTSFIPD